MPETSDPNLLEVILNSWDRNNAIVINLLHATPESGLGARVMESSPTVAQMFMHLHYVRLVFVEEDAPEFARPMPEGEWRSESDRTRMTRMLNESAAAVREAIKGRIEAARAMDLHYDHPLLMLQHLIWHEGYHHGQIKLALKLAGHPFDDEKIGPLTWGLWMEKSGPPKSVW
ncbi:MAG TPA: DinB family protein [Alloacidobacterium sp.]|jgi:uncharacterized damage-inducible protein DinB|nr:DinB family protein [Alloacidobacterium sp.]